MPSLSCALLLLPLFWARCLEAQTLAIAGVDLTVGAIKSDVLRGLSSSGVRLLPNRDTSGVFISGASRHNAFLQFSPNGRLVEVRKTFSETSVPADQRVAMRMEAWREFDKHRGLSSCSTGMIAEQLSADTRSNTISISCGQYTFQYVSLVSPDREALYYNIILRATPH